MNYTADEASTVSQGPTMLTGIFQVLIIIGILVINSISLYIFSKFRNIKIQHYYFIALTVADLATVMTIIPGAMYNLSRPDNPMKSGNCDIYGLVYFMPLEITVLLHSLMSIDKCRAVLNPIDYRFFTIAHRKAQVVTISLILATVVLPVTLNTIYTETKVIKVYFEPLIGTCYVKWDLVSTLAFSIFTLFPLIIQVVTQGTIVWRVIHLNKHNRVRIIRTAKAVFLTIASFYICWFPHGIYIVWRSVYPVGALNSYIFLITVFIVFMQSMLSLPIYFKSITEFRRICLARICRKADKTRVGVETTKSTVT